MDPPPCPLQSCQLSSVLADLRPRIVAETALSQRILIILNGLDPERSCHSTAHPGRMRSLLRVAREAAIRTADIIGQAIVAC